MKTSPRDTSVAANTLQKHAENSPGVAALLDVLPIGVFTLDPEQRITWINPAGTDLLGGQVRDISVAGGWAFVPLNNTSDNKGLVHVLDVSTPSAPTFFLDTFRIDHVARNVEHLASGGIHNSDIVTVVGFPNDPGVE